MRSVYSSAAADLRIERARRWVGRSGERASFAIAYVVTPTALAATRLIAPLIAQGEARLLLWRGTLDVLALELSKPVLIERGLVPLSRVGEEALAARVLEELAATGALGRFARVRDRPGMPSALARTLADLALAGVEVEHLVGHAPELAAALSLRRKALDADGWIDRAGVLELAAAHALDASARVLLFDVPLMHRAEQRFACALLRGAQDGLAIVPAGDERTIEALCSTLELEPEHEVASGPLARVQSRVFEPLSPGGAPDGRVQILSAPGEGRECVEAARVLLDAAHAGTRFERMAVLMRRAAPYRSQLEEAFGRASIPAFFAEGTERPDVGGRALLALLRCKQEGLSASAFCEYLSLDVLPDSADGAAPIASRRFESLIARAHVIGGRDRFVRRLVGFAQELASKTAQSEAAAEGIARDLAELERLRGFALPLLDRLSLLPASAKWGVWLDALETLAQRTLDKPARVLEELAALRPLSASGPVTLEHVMRVLGPTLRELRKPAAPSSAGRVFCGEVEHARGLSFDVVCVLGLAEKVFPAVVREDPLLLDGAREAVSAALETNVSRTLRERLTLRLALGAAREQLALCYPRMDLERGRPRVPSFYGLEALRAAEGKLPSYEALMQRAEAASPARLGWPAPLDPARSIDATEHDLASLRSVLRSDAKTISSEEQGTARYLLNVNPHLGRALRFRAQRWALRKWTSADGLIDPSKPASEQLVKLRLTHRPYAPTALEVFTTCPYRFYLRSVLGLRARVEPERIEDLSALEHGALVHDAIAEFLRRTREQWPLVGDAQRTAAGAELARSLAHVAAEHRERLAPAVPRVFDDAVIAIGRDLKGWLERTIGVTEWRPLAIEESLAADDRVGVQLADGLRVRGRVDLVEERADGQLRATDFKTGKIEAPANARVHGGAMLQPLVYALALERREAKGEPLEHAEPVRARSVESGRLVGTTAKSEHIERVVPLDVHGRASVLHVLQTIDRAIGAGFLPALPAQGACERCDFLALCGPYEPERTARKDKLRVEPLRVLRSMP